MATMPEKGKKYFPRSSVFGLLLLRDQGYQNGSAYMALGLVYLNAPSIVGGDPKKAVKELRH